MLIVIKVITSIAFILFFTAIQFMVEDRAFCTYAQEGQDFKRKLIEQEYLPIMILGQASWINYDKASISISMERNEPISGNSSLRVDILPAVTVNETVNSPWSVMSTDFIPINENSYYNYSLEVSAKDVNQLHSKVYYYDSNKKEIPIENFIFGGTDGTFKEKFSNSFPTTNETKYVQLQMWVRPSLGKPASYLIDNIKIEKGRPNY